MQVNSEYAIIEISNIDFVATDFVKKKLSFESIDRILEVFREEAEKVDNPTHQYTPTDKKEASTTTDETVKKNNKTGRSI